MSYREKIKLLFKEEDFVTIPMIKEITGGTNYKAVHYLYALSQIMPIYEDGEVIKTGKRGRPVKKYRILK